MCMGTPEGRVRSMGGSHMGKVVLIILKLKLTFRSWSKILSLGSKLVSSLTSKPRELDRFRPYFHAYCYLTLARFYRNY